MNREWPGRLVQLATVIVVAAVAAGTLVLSYDGVHSIAVQAGVSATLADLPGRLRRRARDRVRAAPLRDAHWWTRCYTWVVIILVVGLLGAMDAVHAMNVTVPRRQLAGVISVLPWMLLLLGFGLWLAILRHFRGQAATAIPVARPRAARVAGDTRAPRPCRRLSRSPGRPRARVQPSRRRVPGGPSVLGGPSGADRRTRVRDRRAWDRRAWDRRAWDHRQASALPGSTGPGSTESGPALPASAPAPAGQAPAGPAPLGSAGSVPGTAMAASAAPTAAAEDPVSQPADSGEESAPAEVTEVPGEYVLNRTAPAARPLTPRPASG